MRLAMSDAPEYWSRAKRQLAKTDPVFKRLIAAHPDEHLSSRRQLFQSLAQAIVGQQISVAAAASIWARVRKATGGRINPTRVLALDHDALRGCGLSGRKAEYLAGAAETFRGEYRGLRWYEMEDEEIIERLVALRGIGPWTANMVLIFTFLRPDVLPLLDIGLVRAVERHWNGGEPMTRSEIEQLGEAWRPYRTVATWYLWRSIDDEAVAY